MIGFYRRCFLTFLLAGFALFRSFDASAQCTITNLNASYCDDAAAFSLTGTTNYYGAGVTGTTFNPAAAGAGTHQIVGTSGVANTYTVSTAGTYAPIAGSGTSVILANDAITADLPIGFTFNFFGTNTAVFRIVSNGFIRFTGTNPSATSQTLPAVGTPNDLVALAWEDLNPGAGGTIQYFTTGTSPFRKLIINYTNIPFASNGALVVTGQIQLHESTNIIQIHATRVDSDGTTRTMGIENATGTAAYVVTGRNNTDWTATNSFAEFRPTCLDVRTVTIDPVPTNQGVSPAATTICTGSSVNVTITNAQAGVSYQLQNNADSSPLSGFVNGTGANLVIASNAIAANTTIKVYARNNTTLCDTDLTNTTVVTIDQPPTASNAGTNQAVCGTGVTLAANTPIVGTGAWSIVSGLGGTVTAPGNPTSTFTGIAGTTYVLQWTISNGTCVPPSSSTVNITLDPTPTVSNAGAPQIVCGNFTTLNANVPTVGTGQWAITAGAGGTVSDINSATSGFTGTPGVTYTLSWTISNGSCAASVSSVNIQLDAAPTVSAAGPNQIICGNSATLAGNTPVVGTGQWFIMSGTGGNVTTPTSATSPFTGTPGQTYVLEWRISNGSCPTSISSVTIRLDAAPTVSNAGAPQIACGNFTTLNANVPTVGTGQWTITAGAGGTVSDINSATSGFTGTPGVTYTLSWTISNGSCAASVSSVNIQLDAAPTVSAAGPNQIICGNSATLAGNTPVVGTGQWFIMSGTGGNVTTPTSATSPFTGTPGQTYVLEWRISNGSCPTSISSVTIRLDAAPTVSNAGAPQIVCGNFTTLNANVPTVGTGQWAITAGAGGTVSDINSATSGFTGTPGVTYTLSWTISNGSCAASVSSVNIQLDAAPTVSAAGPNQIICGNSATLAGNTPVVGTGQWFIMSGTGGNVTTPTSATSPFTGTPGQTYVLEWRISNGSCPTSISSVTIRLDAAPTVSNAGAPQIVCGNFTTLNANVPTVGTGQWAITAGAGGTVSDINSATSGFTGTPGVTYTLSWTISNGSCAASVSSVNIQLDAAPTVSAAGPNQIICGNSATLAGNTPVVGTGQWFIMSGTGGNVTTPTSATSPFTGTPGQTYVLEWRISNGSCPTSISSVTIRLDAAPTVSNAGAPQIVCGNFTTLNANVPTVGTGQWAITAGAGGTVSDINSATSGFTGTPGVTYTLSWTISNGSCAASVSSVNIQLDAAPTVSAAGPNQIICGNSATLAGNTPVVGTGQWFIMSGTGGNVTTPTSATSPFTGTPGQTYVLEWRISNGSCPTSISSVTIRLDAAPTVSNAGAPQIVCGNFTTLNANVPTVGTGQWAITAGAGGTVSDINSATSGFTGTPGVTYTLSWTISNGSCAASVSSVNIQLDAAPTVSAAGPNQIICGNSATLAGNTPVVGTGQWFIMSGTGGNVTTPTSATSPFTGTPGQTYVLEWRISNGSCPTSVSSVTIRLDATPTVSNAGAPQIVCGNFTTLNANVPTVGTGQWAITAGAGGTVSDINSATSGFTGTPGVTYTLSWTISNGSCAASVSSVNIQLDAAPTVSAAGPNQIICGNSATLAGNTPVVGTGQWFIMSGTGGNVTTPTSATSPFTGTPGQTYVLEWRISNGSCPTSISSVTIRLDATPTVSNAGAPQIVCGNFTTLNANVPTVGTGQWAITAGAGGTVSDINSATSGFTGTPGVTYTLSWTTSNGSCAASVSSVNIQLDAAPTVSAAGPNQIICGNSATLAGNTPVVGTGQWFIMSGTGGNVTTPTSATSPFTGTPGQTYVLEWRISNGSCPTSISSVTIRLDAAPTVSNAGAPQIVCGNFTTLNANVPTVGTGQWAITAGAGGTVSDINSATSGFTGTPGVTYTLSWTISNGSCAASVSSVNIQLDAAPTVSAAGPNQIICGNSATLAGNTPVVGTGQWFIMSGTGGNVTTPTSATSPFTGTPGQTYVLEWRISNGSCPTSVSSVTIRLDATPTVSNAGAPQIVCGNFTTLNANVPTVGTGQWAITAGAGGTVSDINSATSGFTGTPGVTYTLSWTISNGSCAASVSSVNIQLDAAPTVSAAGPNQIICGNSATLAGNTPVVGTGQWFIMSGTGGNVTTPTSATSPFTGTPGQTYVLEWRISNGSCPTSISSVTIRLDAAPTVSNAGAPQIVCGNFTTLNANVPTVGTGQWAITAGAGGTVSDINSATSGFTGTPGVTYTLSWTISNGSCAASVSSVNIQLDAAPTVSAAGPNQIICGNSATLAGNTPVVGTGQWFIMSGTGGNVTIPTSATSPFTGTPGQTYVLEWRISNGSCPTSISSVTIRLDAAPTVSNAGAPQIVCGNFTTLNANVPTVGTGQWAITAGAGGTVSDINSATSGFTGTPGVTYTLSWTISNGSCAASVSSVNIQLDAAPTVSAAGPNQIICGNSATLAGNTPVVGTGQWFIMSGTGGNVTTPTSATSPFTGTPGQTYVLEWRISNGSCPTSISSVTIRLDAAPTVSNAGAPQIVCGNFTTLNANVPTVGTGQWAITAGAGGTVSDINSATSGFTGTPGVTYTLSWTISNGSCAASVSSVNIQLDAAPTVSAAGPNQIICGNSATLAGNTPVVGTGQWFIMSGTGGNVTTPTSATSPFTGTPGQTYVLEWRISNGSCPTSISSVTIRLDAAPTVSNAGAPQIVCGNFTTLNANVPTVGTGQWAITAGAGGTVSDINSATSGFTGTPGVTYTLSWTISNGSCAASVSSVNIQLDAAPTVSAAGPNQIICGNSATLAGNTPVVGTGQWFIMSGTGGNVTIPTSATSPFTGTPGQTYVLEWRISNGSCPTSISSVTIRLDATPTVSNAGAPQIVCGNFTTLNANVPTVGTGQWAITAGAGGTVSDINSATSGFTGTPGVTYTLSWTISNGSCAASVSSVNIQLDAVPTTSVAGVDQNICGPSTTLAANTPTLGTGAWSIVSGIGGNVTATGNPVSAFTGTPGETYVLRWTITNGVCSNFDDVKVELKRIPDADAAPQTICSNSSSSVAISNPNLVPGTTYEWTVFSSTNVTNVSGITSGTGSPISQVLASTNGTAIGTITYEITPVANGCYGTPIQVTVTVTPVPVMTNPPTSLIQDICSGTTLAFVPTSTFGATYTWQSTIIETVPGSLTGVSANGTGAINDTPINSATASAVIIYKITPSNGSCSGAATNLVVTVRPVPDAFAADQTICSGQTTSLTITNPNNVSGTTFGWSVFSTTNITGASPVTGTGTSINQTLKSADGTTVGTVVYRITPFINGCPGTPYDATVTVNPVPVIDNPSTDLTQQICSNETLAFAISSTIPAANYTWTATVSGPITSGVTLSGSGNTITDTPVNTGNVTGTVVYHITPHFIAGCDGLTIDYVVTVKPLPSADASSFTICSGDLAAITILPSPKNVTGTTFAWTALPSNVNGSLDGNGSFISQVLTTQTAAVGTVTYTITPTANGCQGPDKIAVVTVNPAATVNVGADYEVCEALTAPMPIPLTGTIGGSATNGTWIKKTGFGSVSGSTLTPFAGGATVTATYTATLADINAGYVELYLETNDPFVGPCDQQADTVRIQINKRPRIVPLIDQVVCEPAHIDLFGTLAGAAIRGDWSVVSAAPGGSLSVSSITGLNITAKYDTVTADVGTSLVFRLTAYDEDGAGPCVPETDDVTITINESAKVNAGLDFEVCADEVVYLNGSFSGTTSSVTWTGASGTFADVSDPLTSYTLTTTDKAAGQIVLKLETNDPDGTGPTGGPCAPAADFITVIVNPLPAPLDFYVLAPSYAENDDPVPLSGNLGVGVFSGPGILAGTNIFDPGTAGFGPKTIRWTYEDDKGCSDFIEKVTVVNPVTDIDFYFEEYNDLDSRDGALALKICENSGDGYLLELIGEPDPSEGINPTKFRSTNPAIDSRIVFAGGKYGLNTKNLPAGDYFIEYIFTNNLGARDTLTKTLRVLAAPKAVVAIDKACVDNSNIVFLDNSYIPPTSDPLLAKFNWDYGDGNGNTGGVRNPAYDYENSGNYNLKLEVETSQGCKHDTVGSIRVGSPPIVNFEATRLCSGDSTQFKDLSVTFLNTIVSHSWNFDDGDTLGFGRALKNVVTPYNHGGRSGGTYQDPKHEYGTFKVYNVRHDVLTDDGCTAFAVKRIYILDYNVPVPTDAYTEDFEKGPGTWVKADLVNNSWTFGVPDGSIINAVAAADTAWWTGGNTNKDIDNSTYFKNEKSEVIGPCLDISGLERPMISLNYWSDLQEGLDGVVVQYTRDGGITWETLGNAEGGGIDWYNARNVTGVSALGANSAWSDEDETKQWRTARYNLDQIPMEDRDRLVFKVALGSNDDNLDGKVLNGFAFDDVYIGEKTKTVLVEQFLNYNIEPQSDNAGTAMNTLFDQQVAVGSVGPGKKDTDFFKVEYHVEVAGESEELNLGNKVDPFSRAFFYGVAGPPITIMDGIRDGNIFNGDHANIDEVELDRRALEDPKFLIDIQNVPNTNDRLLELNVTFDYVDSLSLPFNDGLLFQVLLVETDVPVAGRTHIYKNVVRKSLLPGQGRSINQQWIYGDDPTPTNQLIIPISYLIDVPITNPNNLYLVAYVQDSDPDGPKATRIYQAKIVKGPVKQGSTVVGVEENPALAEIQNIAVYPNPVSHTLKLQLDEKLSRTYVWKLIDQRGIVVKSGEMNRDLSVPQEINVENLANGMYFLELGLPDQKLMHKKIAIMNRN